MSPSKEHTAEKIVEAGRQLIMRRGYNGFSYADVAEAVDIRKASIHHHFPAKADLAIAVVKESRARFDADVDALRTSGADPLTQLRAYVGYWERCIADDSAPFCVAGMLGAELPTLPDEVASEVRAHFEEVETWLEAAIEAGVEAEQLQFKGTAKSEAATLVSLVYGAMLTARAHGTAALFSTVTHEAVARLVRPQ
jgi:TetR/AcrR family transcriptional regulator, transcriptional repressor for nem operon